MKVIESEDHGHDAGGQDDDPEHHRPGGQGERADGPVAEEVDQAVDEVGAPGGQVERPGRQVRGGSIRARGPWRENSRDAPGQPERRSWPVGGASPAGQEPRPGRPDRTGGLRRAGQPARTHTEPDGSGTGVGADHRAEIGHHQGVLALHALDHAEEVVDVEGGAVAHGQPAEPGGLDGLVGQVPQRAVPGALFGLLFDRPVDQGDHRLDGQEGPEEGAGPTDPPPLLEVLEGVDHAVHLRAGPERSTGARGRRGPPRRRSVGQVEDHVTESHGQRPGVDRAHLDAVGYRFGRGHGSLVGGGDRPDRLMQSTPSYPWSAAASKAAWKAPGDGAEVSGRTVALGAPGPELVGREGGAVGELLGSETDGERDHGDVLLPGQLGREVTCAIGYHPDPGHRCPPRPQLGDRPQVRCSPGAGGGRAPADRARRVCHGTLRGGRVRAGSDERGRRLPVRPGRRRQRQRGIEAAGAGDPRAAGAGATPGVVPGAPPAGRRWRRRPARRTPPRPTTRASRPTPRWRRRR